MKNYVVEPMMNSFFVKEKKTDQYIVSYDSGPAAHQICNKLNKGSGFEGETPAFFLQKFLHIPRKK